MRELDTINKAQLLIKAATGEQWGDGHIVTDIATEYAEPGYSAKGPIVFGNWNPRSFDDMSKASTLAVRLGDALERISCELEWYDEWTRCDDCYRAMRTSADSYGWKMYGAFVEDGYVCADCMRADVESYIEGYINDPSNAVTWCGEDELASVGFAQWEPGDPQTYESGWHPGQTDEPNVILPAILDQQPDAEVVFLINDVGQFDVRFTAWVREADNDE